MIQKYIAHKQNISQGSRPQILEVDATLALGDFLLTVWLSLNHISNCLKFFTIVWWEIKTTLIVHCIVRANRSNTITSREQQYSIYRGYEHILDIHFIERKCIEGLHSLQLLRRGVPAHLYKMHLFPQRLPWKNLAAIRIPCRVH